MRQSKGSGRSRRLPRPQGPRGEDAVEQGLHQGGTEEGRAPVALKAHAQGFLQRGADGGQRRGIAGPFHAGQAVPGVGRQQPGQVFRFGQRRRIGQGAAQVFAQADADLRWQRRGAAPGGR